MKDMFIKVVCIRIGALEYEVLQDVNRGTMAEAMKFINQNMVTDSEVKWELYFMNCVKGILV